jgi:hypothetical protein
MTTIQNFRTSLVAIWVIIVTVLFAGTTTHAQNQYVDYDVFYNELSPHGNWYHDPNYGYVWQPNERNFQPYYTNGYWVMTEYGNTWVSNYSWGWAPFHYGRWTMGNMGWVWIPGTQWGPAWVEWRHGGGYYGWAPMGPQIQINVNVGGWNTPNNWFVFVPQRRVYNRNFYAYQRPYNHVTIYNRTTIINNYYNDRNNRPIYNYGPRREDIRQYTKRNVPVYQVTNAETRGATASPRNNNLSIYRPEVRENRTSAAPRNVSTHNNNAQQQRSTNVTDNRNRNTSSATPSQNVRSSNDSRNNQPATNVVNRSATTTNTQSSRTTTTNSNSVRSGNDSRNNQPATNTANRSTTTTQSSSVRSSTTTNNRSTQNSSSNIAPRSQTTPARNTAPATNTNSRAATTPRQTQRSSSVQSSRTESVNRGASSSSSRSSSMSSGNSTTDRSARR